MTSAIVITDECTNQDITAKMLAEFCHFLFVICHIRPFQSVNLNSFVEVTYAERCEESHQLDNRKEIVFQLNGAVCYVSSIGVRM